MDIWQLHSKPGVAAPHASDDQLKMVSALMRRLELNDFSVCQFANPGMFITLLVLILYIEIEVSLCCSFAETLCNLGSHCTG